MRTPLAIKALRAAVLACGLLGSVAAQAALFGDDEARAAILELRRAMEASNAAQARLAEDNAQLRRSLLDLQAQIDSLRADMARQRGQDEQLQREVSELQRRQKDLSQGMDDRLRKFEPAKVSVDGREFLADPAEKQDYEAALAVFRKGDFAAAQASLVDFIRRYPKSGYNPSALFWLGNAQYATRDYKEAIANFRAMLAQAPDHLRAPEALLSIANCQVELKDTRTARRTLDELLKTYPQSEAAQAGRERLARLPR
ncbi:tol-pal system protein YbgF [Ramlibacter sp. 2FC]|uniref:tol-pal system protein YbgF n=1 Tax=Ramlibacter sp. 2FC TaxID=2502188 RepID=UPI0010FA0114|nr:tol-pal system protein YbgF [Ramlibacter sp. 2FC]